MQETSALYDQIVANPNHWFEPRLSIAVSSSTDVYRYAHQIFSISTHHSLFADGFPQVGCAVAGELDTTFIAPSNAIPKMARISVHVSATDGVQVSEWIKRGNYYIDTREVSHNSDGLDVVTVHAYDSMLKFDQMYPSDSQHDYPMLDVDLVRRMAVLITPTISVDARTIALMNKGYMFTPFGYTMREMLGYIASAYGGNFIITDDNYLLLTQLGYMPEETFYLVTEGGEPITFGGDRILV